MYLLDTNVISTLRRPETAPPTVTAWAAGIPVGDLYLSIMSVYEIEVGIRRVERRDPAQGEILRTWFGRRILPSFQARILPIDEAIAMQCAQLHVPDPRPERDSFIAATALVHRLTLVTRDVRDFVDTGVKLFNPWEAVA
jgi:toxin FitB